MFLKNTKYSSLFVDRDGVINKRNFDGYITQISEFEFLPGVIEAFKTLRPIFDNIFIVTNQQGVGKKIMNIEDLNSIHGFMLASLLAENIEIQEVYCCTHLESENCECRKPKIAFFEKATQKYQNINKENSFIVGDTISDMMFGRNSGIKTVLISENPNIEKKNQNLIDYSYKSLYEFAKQFI